MSESPAKNAGHRFSGLRPACYCLCFTWLLLGSANLWADPEILIDTSRASLSVMEDGKQLLRLEQVAIGRFGSTAAKQQGDGKTPIGKYRIRWIKKDSQFHRFIGFDYPAPADAKRGLSQGLIDTQSHDHIVSAHRRHKVPPQNTKLGGFLGIHGLGQADLAVHRRYNWTRGCIATTNEQMDELLSWIELGMRVEIR